MNIPILIIPMGKYRDGRDVAQVCHDKLLGVTIYQDLTWNKHVDTIVKKSW